MPTAVAVAVICAAFYAPVTAVICVLLWHFFGGALRTSSGITAALRHEMEGLLLQLQESLEDSSEEGRSMSAALLRQVRVHLHSGANPRLPTDDTYSQIRMEVLTSEAVTSAKGYDPKRAAQIYDRMAARPSWNVIAPILRCVLWCAMFVFGCAVFIGTVNCLRVNASDLGVCVTCILFWEWALNFS